LSTITIDMMNFKKYMELKDAEVHHPKHGLVGVFNKSKGFVPINDKLKSMPKGSVIKHEEPIQMKMTDIKLQKIS